MLRDISHILVAHLVELSMLSVGLRLKPHLVVDTAREHPALYVRALAILFLAIPLLAITIATILALPSRTAGLLVVFGVCPAAPYVIRKLIKASERAAADAITLIVLASVLAVALVPAWLLVINAIFGVAFRVAPAALIGVFAVKMLLPLSAGMLVARFLPRIAAKLASAAAVFAALAFALLVLLLMKASWDSIHHMTASAAIALLLMVIGSGALGELAAGHDRDARSAVTVVAVTGSPAIALAVIDTSYPGLDNVAGLVGTYLLLRALAGLVYGSLVSRYRRSHAQPTAA